jgi:uncharacterized protein
MSGKYEIKKAKDGQFKFALKAGNGEIILDSELYTTKQAAINGIESVQKNCVLIERFEHREAKDGQFYFVLKACNHQIIGVSEMYKSKQGAENGVVSVQKNGTSVEVHDLTLES